MKLSKHNILYDTDFYIDLILADLILAVYKKWGFSILEYYSLKKWLVLN